MLSHRRPKTTSATNCKTSVHAILLPFALWVDLVVVVVVSVTYRLRNDLNCVGCVIKLLISAHSLHLIILEANIKVTDQLISSCTVRTYSLNVGFSWTRLSRTCIVMAYSQLHCVVVFFAADSRRNVWTCMQWLHSSVWRRRQWRWTVGEQRNDVLTFVRR